MLFNCPSLLSFSFPLGFGFSKLFLILIYVIDPLFNVLPCFCFSFLPRLSFRSPSQLSLCSLLYCCLSSLPVTSDFLEFGRHPIVVFDLFLIKIPLSLCLERIQSIEQLFDFGGFFITVLFFNLKIFSFGDAVSMHFNWFDEALSDRLKINCLSLQTFFQSTITCLNALSIAFIESFFAVRFCSTKYYAIFFPLFAVIDMWSGFAEPG